MKRIAIISFNHEESSLCLAKYMAKQGVAVDYYYVNRPANKGRVAGFEFWRANVHWGVQQLRYSDSPELFGYMEGLPVQLFLITYDTSRRYSIPRIDIITLWYACMFIRKKKYDAIDIVGQINYVKYCHQFLKRENITHTYHEVGSHFYNVASSPSVQISVVDKSKVILHSVSTYQRYISISDVDRSRVTVIPFGKFETSMLYAKEVEMNIPLDLTKPTFLFIGKIMPYKGIDTLTEAMRLLAPYYDKFNLIVAGSGTDKFLPVLKSLPNCFVYNQYLENDEMIHFIKVCTAVVLPYHTASQTGIIPMISLYGKPSLATMVGAFPEIISNEINGLLVQKDSPSEFANAMFRMIESPELTSKLSLGALKFGNGDNYDWNIIAKKTIDFLLS